MGKVALLEPMLVARKVRSPCNVTPRHMSDEGREKKGVQEGKNLRSATRVGCDAVML